MRFQEKPREKARGFFFGVSGIIPFCNQLQNGLTKPAEVGDRSGACGLASVGGHRCRLYWVRALMNLDRRLRIITAGLLTEQGFLLIGGECEESVDKKRGHNTAQSHDHIVMTGEALSCDIRYLGCSGNRLSL
jgi:hypothetical protein